ncbi:MAG: hypothetical protein ACXVB9_01725 [Bdellovibrionota bacterium]
MKTALFAFAALALQSTSSFAASSACVIFTDTNNNSHENSTFAVYTICDGKQVSSIGYDGGVMVPFTKAEKVLLDKGYLLVTCTGITGNTQCFFQK